ncbi:hypothetical protein [Paenarthrobacter sp. PH39-S1]|uniref:hypothetical protein n=1 Tax=Paenarthrobacter sp. PH39-S1 TaxID=3046204 RepID=UPI0024BB7501|nr:hypothetical protein [Paenarthrobacter sp. PH39-S1]MDJ0356175.1 hypothetical protein [Paenarthrobacter sp. PH39-S1]
MDTKDDDTGHFVGVAIAPGAGHQPLGPYVNGALSFAVNGGVPAAVVLSPPPFPGR